MVEGCEPFVVFAMVRQVSSVLPDRRSCVQRSGIYRKDSLWKCGVGCIVSKIFLRGSPIHDNPVSPQRVDERDGGRKGTRRYESGRLLYARLRLA